MQAQVMQHIGVLWVEWEKQKDNLDDIVLEAEGPWVELKEGDDVVDGASYGVS